MMHAYDEMYLNDAMNNLGDAFDYVKNGLKMDMDEFLKLFISSGVAKEFENGNVTYLIGMSGIELVEDVLEKAGYTKKIFAVRENINKTISYWCGWILAYYQWYSKRPFKNIAQYITMKDIEKQYYILHEAPEDKFVDIINEIIENNKKPTRLHVLRNTALLSQSELSKLSGVSLRSIQMYEQRRKDINKAEVQTVQKLSKALGCQIEDLIEY